MNTILVQRDDRHKEVIIIFMIIINIPTIIHASYVVICMVYRPGKVTRLIVSQVKTIKPETTRYIRRMYTIILHYREAEAGPSGVGLRPLACWDRGFESQRGHGCLSVVNVVCCQVEVSATSLITSLEESYRLWCVVVCNLETSKMRRPWHSLGRSAAEKKAER